MPLVTVCIPVYNNEEYVGQCLDSIINQTLKDIEIICVDDGSTDRSLDVLREYEQRDERIKVYAQEVNKGLGAARNLAISYARGEYVGFVDSDDFISFDMYEKLYSRAKEQSADMSICDVHLYSDGGRVNKRKWFTQIEGKAIPETVYKNSQPWNKIVKRDLINQENILFPERNGDGVYVNLMFAANYITTVNEPLYYYRIRTNSMSSNFGIRHIEESVASCELLLKNCKNYKEYYEFKLIEALLQLLMVSIKENNKETYQAAKASLKKLDFRRNKYLYSLLKNEYSYPVFLAILYLLPTNYQLSALLLGFVS